MSLKSKQSTKTNKKKGKKIRENETQTSKTIIQLAQLELQEQARRRELIGATHNEEVFYSASNIADGNNKGLSLTKLFLSKHTPLPEQRKPSFTNFPLDTPAPQKEIKSPPTVQNRIDDVFKVPQWSKFTIREIRVKSVDASDNNSLNQNSTKYNSFGSVSVPNSIDVTESSGPGIQTLSPKKGSSETSNDTTDAVCCSCSVTMDDLESEEFIKPKDQFHVLISNIKSDDWNISLKALSEISEKAKVFDILRIYTHMVEINQKLIEFLRSPRSQVCRTACQIAGNFFETIKDTRRPEFDDIVELLLMKTADSNKFIRKDANLALDSLIMNVSYIHTIRAISQKGPTHKNDLIRITSARLFVCIVGIAGVEVILNHNGNESTRKRIFENMILFIQDRNAKTREYGIRLYRLMHDHQNFDSFLKKLIDKGRIEGIRKIMRR